MIYSVSLRKKGESYAKCERHDIKPGDVLILHGYVTRGIAIPPKEAYDSIFHTAFLEKEDEEK